MNPLSLKYFFSFRTLYYLQQLSLSDWLACKYKIKLGGHGTSRRAVSSQVAYFSLICVEFEGEELSPPVKLGS